MFICNMLNFTNTVISLLYVHKVGSFTDNEDIRCSSKPSDVLEELLHERLLYFLLEKPFKSTETFRFSSDIGLNYNPLYVHSQKIFASPQELGERGEAIIRQLYEASVHPSIKGGDVILAFFRNITWKEKNYEGIGIFKLEHFDHILQFEQTPQNYQIQLLQGISPDKLDKGCLILNCEEEDGFNIFCHDRNAASSTAYFWKDDFLAIEPKPGDFHFTQQVIDLTRSFVNERMHDEFEVSRPDQIELLNRTADYFKNQERFKEDEFVENVFGDPALISSFKDYKTELQEKAEFGVTEDFDISEDAVKKNTKYFRSIIKLDKNFHVYVHGNREMIERGVDEEGKKFYKLYYNEEH